jgi:hypothetical protein
MLFQRINRNDSEAVYTIVYNVAGSQMTNGYAVQWDISASADGVRVTKPAAAGLSALLGVAAADIADSAYGKVQVYGFKTSGWVYNNQTTSILAGDILLPVTASYHFTRSGASDGLTGFVYAAESYATMTTSITANKKVFIRCL